MALPFYDETTLPCFNLPFENQHTRSKKYLGRKALTGKVYATLNFTVLNDDEMNALHEFWRVDCNYGTEPFVADIPLFGKNLTTEGELAFIVMWHDDFKPTKVDLHWTLKIRIRILAPIVYVLDDLGNYITNDAGERIYTDSSLHTATDNIIDYIQYADITL